MYQNNDICSYFETWSIKYKYIYIIWFPNQYIKINAFKYHLYVVIIEFVYLTYKSSLFFRFDMNLNYYNS